MTLHHPSTDDRCILAHPSPMLSHDEAIKTHAGLGCRLLFEIRSLRNLRFEAWWVNPKAAKLPEKKTNCCERGFVEKHQPVK